MELRHLRYFIVVGEEQHFGRAAHRLRIAQPALSRQIQDLEKEIGFELFERLSRGVKITKAGEVFLKDANRILQQVSEATMYAERVARGHSGILRIGFAENASWHNIVSDSFRRCREQQPGVELQVQPMSSHKQFEAVRSGSLDAGFANFVPKSDSQLRQISLAKDRLQLAVPKGHPLTKLKKLRLRDLTDTPFVWFLRQAMPLYAELMNKCYRGGLKSPRIVQEGVNEAAILSYVATGLGVGWVLETARGRCPESVVILPIVDLNLHLTLSLTWKKGNACPLLANFIAEVRMMQEQKSQKKKI